MSIFDQLENLENLKKKEKDKDTKQKLDPESIPEDFKKKPKEEIPDNVDPETGEIIAPKGKTKISELSYDENVVDVDPDEYPVPHLQLNPKGPFISDNDDTFILSSTLIKEITDQWGNVKDYCPRKVNHLYLTKDYKYHKEVFDYGSYGEYIILGAGAYDNVTDLPKHKVTGKKRVNQKRIEEQAKIHFPRIYKQMFSGMVLPFYNTQIPIYWYDQKNDVVLRAILDHFPAMTYVDGNELKLAIADVKFTANIHSTYGMGWGDPSRMDHLQSDLYLRILKNFDLEFNKSMDPEFDKNVGYDRIFTDVIMEMINQEKITFVNMVFSYLKTDPDNGFKPVIRGFRDYKNPFQDDRGQTVNERIRKTLAHIEQIKASGYEPYPDSELCKDCPIAKLPSGKGGYCTAHYQNNIT